MFVLFLMHNGYHTRAQKGIKLINYTAPEVQCNPGNARGYWPRVPPSWRGYATAYDFVCVRPTIAPVRVY